VQIIVLSVLLAMFFCISGTAFRWTTTLGWHCPGPGRGSAFNEVIYLVKYTSVAYIIQVPELLSQAKFFASDTFFHLEIYFMIGIIYLMLVWVVSKLSTALEHKLFVPGFDISHLR